MSKLNAQPCVRCQTAPRYSRYGHCLYCKVCELERDRENHRAWVERNREKERARKKAWKLNNPDKVRAQQAQRRFRNKDRIREIDKKSRLKHIERKRASVRKWAENNRIQKNALNSARHKRTRRATPAWLTKEQRLEIRSIYETAALFGLTVDHDIPLAGCGKCNACGLHVPWNLQLLSGSRNVTKGKYCTGCLPW